MAERDDPLIEDADEVLAIARVVDSEGMRTLEELSWRELGDLSAAVQDRWYDLWVEDEDAPRVPPDELSSALARLELFHAGGCCIALTAGSDLLEQIASQLDPLWAIDYDTAAEVYSALWLGIGALEMEAMPAVRRWLLAIPVWFAKERSFG